MGITLKEPRKQFYTFADEMLASDVTPMHWRKKKALLSCLKDAVDAVLYGNEVPQRFHLVTIVDAVNVAQSLITLEFIDDPDKLHRDLHKSLARAAKRFLDGRVSQFRLDSHGAIALQEFYEGFESMLDVLPARKVIKAYRHSDDYCRRVIAENTCAATDVVMEL